jgi:hypothetical protein
MISAQALERIGTRPIENVSSDSVAAKDSEGMVILDEVESFGT